MKKNWAKTNITKQWSDITVGWFEWAECKWNTFMEIGWRVSGRKLHQILYHENTHITLHTSHNIIHLDICNKRCTETVMLHAQLEIHVWISLTNDGFQFVYNSNVLKNPIYFYSLFTFLFIILSSSKYKCYWLVFCIWQTIIIITYLPVWQNIFGRVKILKNETDKKAAFIENSLLICAFDKFSVIIAFIKYMYYVSTMNGFSTT